MCDRSEADYVLDAETWKNDKGRVLLGIAADLYVLRLSRCKLVDFVLNQVLGNPEEPNQFYAINIENAREILDVLKNHPEALARLERLTIHGDLQRTIARSKVTTVQVHVQLKSDPYGLIHRGVTLYVSDCLKTNKKRLFSL